MNRNTLLRLAFLIAFIIANKVSFSQSSGGVVAAEKSTVDLPRIRVQLLLPGQETAARPVDAVAVYFSKDFNNEVAYEDSYKFTNADENLAIVRDGVALSIEGRKPVTHLDTLGFKMWKLCQTQYTLNVSVVNLSGATVYLHDSYLKTDKRMDNNVQTLSSFTLNTDAASIAPDRFSLLLTAKTTYTTLPVTLTQFKADRKNKGIEVSWKAENETNIDRYVIERSTDGRSFGTAGTVMATNRNSVSNDYTWFDATQNQQEQFYRVKSIDKSGEVKFSQIVKIQQAKGLGDLVAATTSGSNSITLNFKNSSKGDYKLLLVNPAGTTFYSGNINCPGGAFTKAISLNQYLPVSIYQLVVLHNNQKQNFPLMFH